jgi:glycosyltransferase involved in cell wall biosynthesis
MAVDVRAVTPSGQPIRVGFLLTGLVGGGAERSMLSIIEALDRTRFEPVLILFEERIEHAPPTGVPIIVLDRRGWSGLGRMASRVFQLARVIRRARLDLVVSFLVGSNIVSIAAARLAGVPVVVGERSAPRIVLSRANRQLRAARLWAMLVRRLYPRASAIVTNTQGAKAELTSHFGATLDRIVVIPNAVDLERIRALATEPLGDAVQWPDGPVLVHVGRFTYAKDHETLLKAFAMLRAERPVSLVLVGDGEDEGSVRQVCRELGLDHDVVFTGFTRNPYTYLARATLCVLTSRFEGLPNALLEAMALGIPIVSTACQYGPLELLAGGEGGVLAPVGDAPAFAGAVAALLDAPERRRELAAQGLRRVVEFDRRRVASLYEELFERTARRVRR